MCRHVAGESVFTLEISHPPAYIKLTLSNARPPRARRFRFLPIPSSYYVMYRCRHTRGICSVDRWFAMFAARCRCRGVLSHPCFARDNEIHCPRGAPHTVHEDTTIIRRRGGMFFLLTFFRTLPRSHLCRSRGVQQCCARVKSRERSAPANANRFRRTTRAEWSCSRYSVCARIPTRVYVTEVCVSYFSYNK